MLTDIADEEKHTAESLGSDVNGNRESSDSGADTYEINEQDDIDSVLLSGSGFEGGKQTNHVISSLKTIPAKKKPTF